MRITGKKLAIVSITIAMSAILAGCTSGPVSHNGPNSTNANVISLGSTPHVGKVLWKLDKAKLPQGFSELASQTSSNPPTQSLALQNQDKSCHIIYSIQFGSSFDASKGDAYLTKNYLYMQAQNSKHAFSGEKNLNVNAEGSSKVEFDSLSYNYVDTSGTNGTVNSLLAARAFDTLQPNGYDPSTVEKQLKASGSKFNPSDYSTKGPYDSDTTKGIPMAVVTYECLNVKPTEATLTQALKAVTLTGITTAQSK